MLSWKHFSWRLVLPSSSWSWSAGSYLAKKGYYTFHTGERHTMLFLPSLLSLWLFRDPPAYYQNKDADCAVYRVIDKMNGPREISPFPFRISLHSGSWRCKTGMTWIPETYLSATDSSEAHGQQESVRHAPIWAKTLCCSQKQRQLQQKQAVWATPQSTHLRHVK